MFHFLSESEQKPNRFDFPDKDTNKDYHLKYGKFTLSDASASLHAQFISKTKLNKNFYRGNQWVYKEDVEAFLKDDTNQDRNRIKVVHNLIRPMIEQYRGNAIRLSINATAKSVSKKAVNRRESSLNEKILKTRVAEEFPNLGRLIKDADKSIGDSEKETIEIHENLYVDSYTETINRLLDYSKKLNKFESMQLRVAQNLGLSGLGVVEGFEHGGHMRYEVVESEEFFFDRSARELDLSDADYMGKCTGMLPTDVFETWQEIKEDDKKAIESFVSDKQSHNTTHTASEDSINIGSTKIPVCHSYWRDHETKEAGWVFDEYGYPYLVYLNETVNPVTDEPYTEADLIEPPSSPKNDRIFKGRKKRKMSIDILRYCIFIPGEFLGRRADKNDTTNDIVLDFGVHDYQETEWMDLSNVKFPFKCSVWGYVDGEIMSPVDDAINPQRFINRILSVAESQINNSGGTNVVVDKDALDAQDGESAMQRDINNGKPITLRTKGRGVPNSIGTYDATPKQGTYALFNIIPLMEDIIQKDTGVNEGLKGESTGSDQLVGVTQLMIQRGSLMQEPFYEALGNIFLQMYQHTATVGKRMYIDNERDLAIAVGDDGVSVLEMAEGMRNEDFRVFIERDNDMRTLIAQGDQQLNILLPAGLIDDITYSNLAGRSTPDQVFRGLREFAAKKLELNRQRAKQDQQDRATAQGEIQAQDARNNQAIESERRSRRVTELDKHENKMDEILLKGELDNANQLNNNV